MQIGDIKNKVGNSRGVSYSFYINVAADRFHAHFAFQVARFYAESMSAEFPKIKAYSDNHR